MEQEMKDDLEVRRIADGILAAIVEDERDRQEWYKNRAETMALLGVVKRRPFWRRWAQRLMEKVNG